MGVGWPSQTLEEAAVAWQQGVVRDGKSCSLDLVGT